MIRSAKSLSRIVFAVLCLVGMQVFSPVGTVTARMPTQLPQSEIDALVALYNATDGAHWTNNTGWLTAADPCGGWYGISCGSHTWPQVHVIWVHLANNNLTGQLPPEIVNLIQLDELLLNDNHLTGPLPAGMDNFDYIINLCLQNNQFSGSIPADLGGISDSPGGRKLLRLFLDHNLMEGPIPPELGDISSLRYLQLNNNRLTGEIPGSLGNLTGLWELDLSFNQLYNEIPQSLGNLTGLRKFNVDDNYLTGRIPTWLGSKPYLTEVKMAYNNFTGPIPDELSASTNLEVIWLGQNRLTGNVPASLGTLSNLRSLWVEGNYLKGQLPESLVNLDQLYTFWYDNSYLCEPCDDTFLDWLKTIPDLRRTFPCEPGLEDIDPWTGRSGSYFPFHAYCLRPNSWYVLEINHRIITQILTDEDGRFNIELRSDDPAGYAGDFLIYFKELAQPEQERRPPGCSAAGADDLVSAVIMVRPDAPLLPSGGNPNIYPIPQGIGKDHWIYLPSLKRTRPLSILLGNPNTPNGLSLQEGGDFDTAVVTAGSPPVTARRTGNGQALPSADSNPVGDYYLQIDAEDSAIAAGNPTTHLRIEVEYLDQGMDQFMIQYDAQSGGPFQDGRFKDTPVFTKTGSGQWRSAIFLIEDAYFANRDHGGDFRIYDMGDGYEIIRKVTVTLQ